MEPNPFLNMLKQGAGMAAYAVPGLGQGLAARDAYRNVQRGNYGMAAVDVGLGLLGGGAAIKLLGKGAKAAKAAKAGRARKAGIVAQRTGDVMEQDFVNRAAGRIYDLSDYSYEDLVNETRKATQRLMDRRMAAKQNPNLFPDDPAMNLRDQNYIKQLERALGVRGR